MEPKKEMDENGDQQMDEVVISEAEPQAELPPELTSPSTPTGGEMVVVRSGQLEGMDPETGDYIRPPAGSTPQKPLQIPKIVEPSSEGNGEEGGRKARKKLGQHANNNVTTQSDHNQLTTTSGKSLKRGWSRRMISTISNKSRTEEEEEEDGGDNCIFGNQIRFTIMIISTLCLSSILSNILTFNFTFICMAGNRPDNYTTFTDAELQASGYRPDLDYSSAQRSALFMAVAVGALLAVFPLTIALNKFGSRLVFGILGYISACSTYLIPVSANIGFPCILLMRVIQGVGFSACLPVMGSITSHWSTLKQNGIFIAILSSFLQIAPIFTMPISGELCTSSLGWPAVYYLHGTVCVFLFTLFILYHRNTPNKHPLIQRTELTKMMFGKGSIYSGPGRQRKSNQVPYAAMYRDPAIWAILVAAFGNFMGTQLSLQFMPTYINKVLFLPIEQTGMASAISPVIMFFIKLLAGQSSDRITFISDQVKLRIYNTLSMGLMGFFFIVLGMLDPVNQKSLCLASEGWLQKLMDRHKFRALLPTTFCLKPVVLASIGQFHHILQPAAGENEVKDLYDYIYACDETAVWLDPTGGKCIDEKGAKGETWKIVLWIHGIILIATNIFFCFFASSRPARWTLDSWSHNRGAKVAPGAVPKQLDVTDLH